MQIKVEVLRPAFTNMTVQEIAEEILKAEIRMNSESKLRFHVTGVTMKELKQLQSKQFPEALQESLKKNS